ncbi:MAG: hypothetical protein ACFE7R_10715, partial [Candidatus Hodarchaeota archaeon]
YETPRTFEMYTMAEGYGAYPDYPWYRMHKDNDVDGGFNPFGWDNSTFDEILDRYLNSTPLNFFSAAEDVQIAATDNMPYIPLFLSDDTHALREEWINFTIKPGGPFTAFSPETMVFMYDSEATTNTTPTPTSTDGGFDIVVLVSVGAAAMVTGVVCTYFFLRRE